MYIVRCFITTARSTSRCASISAVPFANALLFLPFNCRRIVLPLAGSRKGAPSGTRDQHVQDKEMPEDDIEMIGMNELVTELFSFPNCSMCTLLPADALFFPDRHSAILDILTVSLGWPVHVPLDNWTAPSRDDAVGFSCCRTDDTRLDRVL